jgi:hypothetical protein
LLVVAAVWSGLSYVESDVRESVHAVLPDVTIDNIKIVGGTLRTHIAVQNNSMVDLTLESVSCQGAILDLKFTCGDLIKPVKIPKGHPIDIPLNVVIARPDTSQGAIDLSPSAETHVRAWGIPVSSPFDLSNLLRLDPVKLLQKVFPVASTEGPVVRGGSDTPPKKGTPGQRPPQGQFIKENDHQPSTLQDAAKQARDEAKRLEHMKGRQ